MVSLPSLAPLNSFYGIFHYIIEIHKWFTTSSIIPRKGTRFAKLNTPTAAASPKAVPLSRSANARLLRGKRPSLKFRKRANVVESPSPF